jgi:hypothetical protein
MAIGICRSTHSAGAMGCSPISPLAVLACCRQHRYSCRTGRFSYLWTTRAVFKLRYGIAARCEPAVSVHCGNGRQCLIDRQLQCLAGACLGGTQEGFDLRPGWLDGREIRRGRRPGGQPGPAPLNDLTNGCHVMSAHVIQDDDVARAPRRDKDLLRICVKASASVAPSIVMPASRPCRPRAAIMVRLTP